MRPFQTPALGDALQEGRFIRLAQHDEFAWNDRIRPAASSLLGSTAALQHRKLRRQRRPVGRHCARQGNGEGIGRRWQLSCPNAQRTDQGSRGPGYADDAGGSVLRIRALDTRTVIRKRADQYAVPGNVAHPIAGVDVGRRARPKFRDGQRSDAILRPQNSVTRHLGTRPA